MKKILSIFILFIMLTAFTSGHDRGLTDGTQAGTLDCLKYGETDVLHKIPTMPFTSADFKNGYKNGYLTGYHSTRYAGLH